MGPRPPGRPGPPSATSRFRAVARVAAAALATLPVAARAADVGAGATKGPPPNVVLLDAIVFIVGVAILGAVIAWFGRRIFRDE